VAAVEEKLMKQVIHDAAAKGFQAAADAYERGRPEYPLESVHRLIQELHQTSGVTVVDLGAGTGKFTKLSTDNCEAQVVAIEPVEGIRRWRIASAVAAELAQ
jgi:ubiquinone/menaquinone biosynthesis C-methylase UbiE